VLLMNVWPYSIAMVPTEKLRRASLFKNSSFNQSYSIYLMESYTALVDMGIIWRMATPSPEDCQTQDGTSVLDYFHKVTSIIFVHHNNAQCIICVNDPYTEIPTKDDEQDLRVQGKVHVPNEIK